MPPGLQNKSQSAVVSKPFNKHLFKQNKTDVIPYQKYFTANFQQKLEENNDLDILQDNLYTQFNNKKKVETKENKIINYFQSYS